jgi:hypothetical protein
MPCNFLVLTTIGLIILRQITEAPRGKIFYHRIPIGRDGKAGSISAQFLTIQLAILDGNRTRARSNNNRQRALPERRRRRGSDLLARISRKARPEGIDHRVRCLRQPRSQFVLLARPPATDADPSFERHLSLALEFERKLGLLL